MLIQKLCNKYHKRFESKKNCTYCIERPLSGRQRNFLRNPAAPTKRSLQQKVFGHLKPISHQEYSRIYHSTGIDVDGRRAMLEHMVICIERAIKRFIAFAKAVPGFKEFHLDDQIKLIKGTTAYPLNVWCKTKQKKTQNEKHTTK
ncbi:hypothetical protein HELRODRAFT_178562 [Helobdella robusta]|uniref:Uncharacterized protein n=1 Tax=Helobdella robusta TaxID=6412 RepID=T1FDE0_HELRO|nr:hypothetical protein HELRODRAFT_178562 [Helobdella robusta]ESN97112.1 hypothetical protein HELRODRAFT_178562 [Helobdella robusta]